MNPWSVKFIKLKDQDSKEHPPTKFILLNYYQYSQKSLILIVITTTLDSTMHKY
jgi:hypothetical protein